MANPPDLQDLSGALSDVRAELVRADQKAATLLALFSAITAGIVATFAVRKSGIFALWNGAEWLAWLGIGCIAASLVHLLFCVRPGGVSRLGGGGYFAYYAQYQGRVADLVTQLSTTTDAELERCTQLVELSSLATRKYKLIARAVDLLGCALSLVAAATLLDAVS
ncbi:Pycsar system effector family protein [Streptomyces avermitilis]|uniref:Pycsar system effector family protein n=1 Tax=Streptomyces avermitilis TaxID=33903 RepID=UPI0033EB7D5F